MSSALFFDTFFASEGLNAPDRLDSRCSDFACRRTDVRGFHTDLPIRSVQESHSGKEYTKRFPLRPVLGVRRLVHLDASSSRGSACNEGLLKRPSGDYCCLVAKGLLIRHDHSPRNEI